MQEDMITQGPHCAQHCAQRAEDLTWLFHTGCSSVGIVPKSVEPHLPKSPTPLRGAAITDSLAQQHSCGSHLGCSHLLLMAVAGHERSNILSSVLLSLTSVVQLPLIPAGAEIAATAFHIRVLHSEGGMVTGGTAVFERLSKNPTWAWSGRGSREPY